MVNAHFCIMYLIAKEHQTTQNFPFLCRYAEHPMEWRSFLAEVLDLDMAGAKDCLIPIGYLGKPKHDLPHLWALATDIDRFTTWVLELPEFEHLSDHFAGRKNPRATRLFYVLTKMEDKLLEACTAEIVTALPNVLKAQGAAEAKNEVGHV